MKTALEIAKGMVELLEQPGKWGQGEYAIDADGNEVRPIDEKADCFCLQGAADHVAGKLYFANYEHTGDTDPVFVELTSAFTEVLNEGAKEPTIGMVTFNDDPDTTHMDVVAVCKKVVDRLEQQEAA